MRSLLWRSSLRHLIHHPWHPLLSVVGIALGVAVVLAVELANFSARISFQHAIEQVSGHATHRIQGLSSGFSETVYSRLRVHLGIQDSAPVVTGFAEIETKPGLILQVLGVDLLTEGRFRDISMKNLSSSDPVSVVSILKDRNAAIVPSSLTRSKTLTLLAASKRLTLSPLILLDDPGLDGLIITDISTAQELFGLQGKLSYIDLILPEGRRGRKLSSDIQALLPQGLQITPALQRSQAVGNLSNSFSLNLTAMSLLAMLVGMFLIYNAVAFSVVQRRSQLGLLRALGVSRHEVFAIVLGEAFSLGILGTLIGSALGISLGSGLVDLVTRTINDLYYPLTVKTLSISAQSLLKVVVLGILVTILAACLPALEAANALPSAVLSRVYLETRWRAALPWLNLGGLLLFALGAATVFLYGSLVAGFGGLFLLILGCALLTPAGLLLISRILASSVKHSGLVLLMACRDIGSHLSRTGMAAAALTVAFSAAVGVGVMVDSFRSGVSAWLSDLLTADLYISAESYGTDAEFTPLDPQFIKRLSGLSDVMGISTFNHTHVLVNGQLTRLVITDLAPIAQSGYRFLAGEPRSAWNKFNLGEAVLISEPLAFRHNLAVDDRIALPTPEGLQEFPVVGIYRDYSSEHGRILLHRSAYNHYWHDYRVRSLAVYAHAQTNLAQLRNKIAALGHSYSGQALRIRSNREIRERSLRIFERTFTITSVLRVLAVGIAFVGVLSALMALQLDRIRDYATLRTLGMTSKEISQLISLQTTLMGCSAGLLAIPIGLLMAAILIYVINRRAFGWTMPVEVDIWLLIQCVLLAGLAAYLAGLYPAWRIGRTAPADALRAD